MLKHALFLLRFFLLGISLFNIPLTPNLYAGDKSRTVIDSAGRKVTVPFEIKRIACLYAFAGHAVTMLGRGDDIVAISNGLRRDSLLHEICPSIMNAMVPKSQGAINFEELLRAAPDILFLARESANNKAEMDKLERFNIPVLIVDYSDIKGQQHAVEMIGEAIGSHRKASIYTDYFEACIKRVQKAVESIPMEQRPKLYHSVNEATRTTIEEGLTSDWLKVTGAINVASSSRVNLMEGKNFVSLEQILLWDPDIILANEPSVVRDVMKNRQMVCPECSKEKKSLSDAHRYFALGASRFY